MLIRFSVHLVSCYQDREVVSKYPHDGFETANSTSFVSSVPVGGRTVRCMLCPRGNVHCIF